MRGFTSPGEQVVTGMRARQGIAALTASAIVAIAMLLPAYSAAQQTDLSQQMQLFNNLSPEQQQALMQRLGGGSGLGSSGISGLGGLGGLGGGSSLFGGGTTNRSQSALLQQLQLQQQRRLAATLQDQGEFPVFKPGDTVLVEVSLLTEKPLGNGDPNNPNGQNTPGQNTSAAGSSATAGSTPRLSNSQLSALGLDKGMSTQRLQEQPQRTIEQLQVEERLKLEDMIEQIRSRNPYVLDASGQLLLPGIPGMQLAGLSEDLATRRVSAEPAFEKLFIRLTRLPLDKSGKAALKPFGYELFDNSLLSLMPTLDAPVPDDYVMGPGDVLQVQLFGSKNQMLTLLVGRDGHLSFPELGPIQAGGLRYSAVKSEIESRVAREMIGVRANVTAGETRTINIFVLGSAKYPGSYTVSGLATVTTALFAAGGVEPIGSLRSVQVKRQGQTVRTFDLYDLLMRGDSASDIKLLPGDVVFIPPVGATAALDGEVQRPAIYELKEHDTIANLIQMGGGLTPSADDGSAALIRVDAQQQRIVMDVNPSRPPGGALPLRNGDELHVARLRPQLDSGVILQGYVYRSKYVAWHEGLRISGVIPSIDELRRDADQHYLLIRRELPPHRTIAVLSADLAAALQAPGSPADIELLPRDTITVFDLQTPREHVIESLMDELRLQSNLARRPRSYTSTGGSRCPATIRSRPTCASAT
jgi:protein involved in polysaccharide export with SLBB domain